MYFKVLFMTSHNQSLDSLQDVRDIRKMMERSSRFTSLSGLSFVAAGLCALAGAWFAYKVIRGYYAGDAIGEWVYSDGAFRQFEIQLLLIAGATFVAALSGASFFTWRKAARQGEKLGNHVSRKVFWSMAIPLAAGAIFTYGMLDYNEWRFVAPACLLFYGLSLVNAGKYTVADIKYLGYCEILLALINMQFVRKGFYFWVIGFGVLHIIYGVIMWWKYERAKA
ncbi:MAG: hypothetical protein DI535_01070 [Citrobacter freundii]|nr:MAG: hypothetical protein DI535_01070 [Citrobacter freundii]